MFTLTLRIIGSYMNRIMDKVLDHPSHIDLRIAASLLFGLGLPFAGLYFYSTMVLDVSLAAFMADDEAGFLTVSLASAYVGLTVFFGATLPWYFAKGRE